MSEKIKSPKSNRYIYIHGNTYNQLIKDGYTEEYLQSLPKIKAEKLMSPKYTKSKISNQFPTNIDDVNLEVLNQIYDVYDICQTDKYFYNLCMKNNTIKNKYFKQQKIHHRLDKLINALKNHNNVVYYIKYESDYNINNFDKLFYYSPTYRNGNKYIATLFIVTKNNKAYIADDIENESTYVYISFNELYNKLFIILNEFEPIYIQLIKFTKKHKKNINQGEYKI